jgi:hypothetical protein
MLPPGQGQYRAGVGRGRTGARRAARAAIGNRIEKQIESENETDLNDRPPIDRDHDRRALARDQNPLARSLEDQRGPVAPGFAGTDRPPT